MSTSSFLALRQLTDSLPSCDALNLGYAVLIEGEMTSAALEQAVYEVAASDPLLKNGLVWSAGGAERERFAYLAAEHLSRPLQTSQPLRASLWSSDPRTHLFLFSIHHQVADGVVLDRLAGDLSRSLQGKPLEPVAEAEQRPSLARARFNGAGLPLPKAAPSVRASCRSVRLTDKLVHDLHEVVRGWRTTPFAAAVACVASVIGAWSETSEVGLSIQIANRNSVAAQRAPGPWYDHVDLDIHVDRDEPLRAVLLEATEQTLKALSMFGNWSIEQTAPGAEVLVVYDRHPFSSLKIPGCDVRPLAVHRHPVRPDGVEEYLVQADADLVVFFREQAGVVGLSLFTKPARIPDETAQWLLSTIVDALRALCEAGEEPFELSDRLPVTQNATATSSARWPEPRLSDLPMVDAVSPAFHLCPSTLDAFANDARQTLDGWGKPPWL